MMLSDLLPEDRYEPDELFGELKRFIPAELSFLPVWQIIEKNFLNASMPDRSLFMEGSLSSLRDDFFCHINASFSLFISEIIHEKIGDMPPQWRKWIDEKLLPTVYNRDFYENICRDYTVFNDRIILVIEDAIAHLKEITSAISDNRELLANHFFKEQNGHSLRIRKIHSSGADQHEHGRSVHIIEYENGLKLVWKPRDFRLDRAFGKWLDWLCDKCDYPEFIKLQSIDIGKGAFCAFATPSPLNSPTDAPVFYERAGFLLGAIFLLGGGDIHAENLIACGSEPVLVDTETCLYVPNPIGDLMGHRTFHIDGTNFLPFLGSGPGLYPGFDALSYSYEGLSNFAYYGNEAFNGSDFPDAVETGFLKAISAFLDFREEGADFAASVFKDSYYRYLMRPTKFYAIMLRLTSTSEAARSYEAYHRVLSRMDVWTSYSSDSENSERLLSEEKDSLFRTDLPLFHARIDETAACLIRDNLLAHSKKELYCEASYLKFLLEKHSATEKTPCLPSGSCRQVRISDLEETASHIKEALTINYGIVGTRNNSRLYLCPPVPAMLEGGLGAVVSLAIWHQISGDQKSSDIIKRYVEEITEMPHLMSAGITSSEPGLCEGMGGFLIGMEILRSYSFVSDDMYESFLKKVPQAGFKENCYLYNLGYGYAGLLHALNFLGNKTNSFEELIKLQIHLRTRVNSETKATTDQSLISGIKGMELALKEISFADIYPKNIEDATFTDNYTLAHGMAGLLHAATCNRLLSGDNVPSDYEKACAAALLNAKKPSLSTGLTAYGLIYGEAGKLYSLCYHLSPGEIPGIFSTI